MSPTPIEPDIPVFPADHQVQLPGVPPVTVAEMAAQYRATEQRPKTLSAVNHPSHYGGDTTYETIKVIEAWGLGFHLGNAVKYISRAGRKGDALEDLRKAAWYLAREIERLGGEVG